MQAANPIIENKEEVNKILEVVKEYIHYFENCKDDFNQEKFLAFFCNQEKMDIITKLITVEKLTEDFNLFERYLEMKQYTFLKYIINISADKVKRDELLDKYFVKSIQEKNSELFELLFLEIGWEKIKKEYYESKWRLFGMILANDKFSNIVELFLSENSELIPNFKSEMEKTELEILQFVDKTEKNKQLIETYYKSLCKSDIYDENNCEILEKLFDIEKVKDCLYNKNRNADERKKELNNLILSIFETVFKAK